MIPASLSRALNTLKTADTHLDDATVPSAKHFGRILFRRLLIHKKSKTPESRNEESEAAGQPDPKSDVPTPEEPAPRFRLSDGHRDSLYSLLSAIGSACPIPAISPCITLIEEIDSTFRRARLQL